MDVVERYSDTFTSVDVVGKNGAMSYSPAAGGLEPRNVNSNDGYETPVSPVIP